MDNDWLKPYLLQSAGCASPPERLRIGGVEYALCKREPQVQVYCVPERTSNDAIGLRVIVDGRILDLYARADADLMEVVRQCLP